MLHYLRYYAIDMNMVSCYAVVHYTIFRCHFHYHYYYLPLRYYHSHTL